MKCNRWFLLVLSTSLLCACGDEHPHTPIEITETASQLQLEFLHLEKEMAH